MRTPRQRRAIRRYLLPILAGTMALAMVPIWLLERTPRSEVPVSAETAALTGPPWRYGRLDARFTLIEYADLECPYCKEYFPVLKRWIDANPDVNWQWHHLPLAIHEPAATRGARLAECAGETGGPAAFWKAVDWIYQHTRGDGQGLPPGVELPGKKPDLDACLSSTRPDAVIQVDVEEAAQAGIAATPTLRVVDNQTGKSLLLSGIVEGDALLSAIDLLSSSADEAVAPESATTIPETSADLATEAPG
jgi:protein-disulfide isomerase